MKKYIFLDFYGVISQMKRLFYGALKFIAVYILMVMLFMSYFYWYPDEQHESSCPYVPRVFALSFSLAKITISTIN